MLTDARSPHWRVRTLRATVLLVLCVAIVTTAALPGLAVSNAAGSLLQIDYGERAPDVVNVRLENVHTTGDGMIAADIFIENRKAVTYDMSVGGYGHVTMSCNALDLVAYDGFFPLVGRRTWPADGYSQVIFAPGAILELSFDKFGGDWTDAVALFGFDLAAMITLATLGSDLPTVPSDMIPGIRDGLIGLLNNAGFDMALFVLAMAQEDYWGAAQQLASVIADIPQVFADWMWQNLKVAVSAESVAKVAKWMRAVPVIPVVWDLFAAPKHVEVRVTAQGGESGHTDVVLVIDSSGSMAGTKLAAAKSAAQQFVDFMRDEDMVGVVEFNTDARVAYPLTIVTASSRAASKAAIDAIVTTGVTSIGDGLRSALHEIAMRANAAHVHSILLLSDGAENEPEYVATVLPDLLAAGLTVHTVGLGDGANTALLSDIASQTGGTFHYAPGPEQLAGIYDLLSADVSHLTIVQQTTGYVGQNETVSHALALDPSVVDPEFGLSWPGSTLSLTLESPSGFVVDPAVALSAPDIHYIAGPTYAAYVFDGTQEAGAWVASITGVDTGGGDEAYQLSLRARTQVRLEAYTSASVVQPGARVTLTAYAHDNAGGIETATLIATVIAPDGARHTLPLLADTSLGPGYFTATLANTSTSGGYRIRNTATGVSNEGLPFTRDAYATFVVQTIAQPHANTWISLLGDTEAEPGDTVDYTLLFGNSGPQQAPGVGIVLDPPAGTTVVSTSIGSLVMLPGGLGQGWLVGDIAVGEVKAVALRVLIQPGTTGSALSTHALIAGEVASASPVVSDPYPDNNEATILTHLGISRRYVWMPLVSKRWPPIPDTPVLNPISNPDGDGTYTVAWNAAYLAANYVLQEDDQAAFSSPSHPYSGPATSWNATGRSPGTYYYRVKASNSWGDSAWSSTQKVTVSPPATNVYVQNDTAGTLCYEIPGSGQGERCLWLGTSFYGSFASGTYSWRASAWCGTSTGTTYFAPGDYYHRFWCGLPLGAPSGRDHGYDVPSTGERAVLLTAIVGPSP